MGPAMALKEMLGESHGNYIFFFFAKEFIGNVNFISSISNQVTLQTLSIDLSLIPCSCPCLKTTCKR